jgi:nucleotide-binding universal stress UspA family protein
MYRRILVAVDGSKASEAALKGALDLAKAQSAEMRLLHVIDSPYAYPEALYAELSTDIEALRRAWHRAGQAVLDRATALARDAEVRAETALLEMDGRRISRVIVDEAKRWHADLIVVATYGRHEEVLLGSVAEDVARTASVSVLLVRSQ